MYLSIYFMFVSSTVQSCLIYFLGQEMNVADLKQWASGRMVPYQIPTVLLVVDELPRNTMGKVNKKELNVIFFGKE